MAVVRDASTVPAAVRGCLEACRRCQALLDHVTRSTAAERAYAAIGPHLRHCLDHFTCLLRGLDSGTVDYDGRERDPRLENDPQAYRVALDAIVERLARLEATTITRALWIRQAAAGGGEQVDSASSVERELVFLSGHTVHHLAIMKLLAGMHGVLVPGDLDYAFSTAAYLEPAD
jgi:hypothetical protein